MIEHFFHLEHGFVQTTVRGRTDLEEFKSAANSLLYDRRFTKELHRLCDFSEADLSSISTLDVIKFTKVSRMVPMTRDAKLALVGTRHRKFLLSFLNSMTKYDVRYFDRVTEAKDWLTHDKRRIPSDLVALELNGHIKVHKLVGRTTMESAKNFQLAWHDSPEFDVSLPVVWDLRSAVIVPDMLTIEKEARKMDSRRNSYRPNAKVAILVENFEQAVVLRHAFTESLEAGEINMFSEESDVINWLANWL